MLYSFDGACSATRRNNRHVSMAVQVSRMAALAMKRGKNVDFTR
jgi:hypothetical protein